MKQRIIPHTKKFDERVIGRRQESFSRGMISDKEGVDIPINAVSKLVNCKGYNNGIRGSRGSMEWIRNLRIPRVRDNITFTCYEDGTLVADQPGVASQYAVGYYVFGKYGGEEYWFKISGLPDDPDGYTVMYECGYEELFDGANFTDGYVTGPINARFYDDFDRLEYMMVGRNVFFRNDNDDNNEDRVRWEEVFNPDFSSMANTQSVFMKIEGRLTLINNNGSEYNGIWFIEKDVSRPYLYPANGYMPVLPLDRTSPEQASNPSVYRYLYGLCRIKGNALGTRNDNGNIIQVETPPYLLEGNLTQDKIDETGYTDYEPFDKSLDYCQRRISRPIDDTYYLQYLISDDWLNYGKWVELTEGGQQPQWKINLPKDGAPNTRTIHPDFSNVEKMNDVAGAIESAFNDIDGAGGFKVIYQGDKQSFEVRNSDSDLDWDAGLPTALYSDFDGYVQPYVESYGAEVTYRVYDDEISVFGVYRVDNQYEYNDCIYYLDSIEYDKDDNPLYYNATKLRGDDSIEFIKNNSGATHKNMVYRDSAFVDPWESSDVTVTPTTGGDYTTVVTDSSYIVVPEQEKYDIVIDGSGDGTPNALFGKFGASFLGSVTYNFYGSSIVVDKRNSKIKITAGTSYEEFDFPLGTEFTEEYNSTNFEIGFYRGSVHNGNRDVVAFAMSGETFKVDGEKNFVSTDLPKIVLDMQSTTTTTKNFYLASYATFFGGSTSASFTPSVVKDKNNSLNTSGIGFSMEDSSSSAPILAFGKKNNSISVTLGENTSPNYTIGNVFYPTETLSEYLLNRSEILTADNTRRYMASTIGKFRYPDKRGDITHYSLYRTADIYPSTVDNVDLTDPRLGNSTGFYAWVDDIPVVEVVSGVFESDTKLKADNPDKRLLGATLRTHDSITDIEAGDVDVTITGILEDGYEVESTDDIIAVFGTTDTHNFVIGSESFGVASVNDDGELTIDGGNTRFTLDNMSRGQLIYFASEDTDASEFIESVDTDAGTAQLVSNTPRVEQIAVINPTERVYGDSTNDINLIAQGSYWPLKTRFYKPIISSPIAAHTQGVYITAQGDNSDIQYVGTDDVYRMGYHHSVYQTNNNIEEGIRCIMSVNGVFAVLSTSKTYQINPRNFQVITEEDFGTYYILMPTPKLIHGSIGTIDQFRWKQAGRGNVVVLTNEPGVRFFNGNTFDKNLAEGSVQNSQIMKMDKNMIIHFNPNTGIELWGKKDGR